MTKQEIQAKSNSKRKAIEVLLAKMDMVLVAQQVVGRSGLVENSVLFIDNEKYPEEAPVEKEKKND